MPSSLNADNGVVSGTAGLKSSADSSGVLDLQTNGTTAISISASQVVSFANQPTYTGGTANGVMYLNGSKAVTTGTALVFDGTNLGIGTASPNGRLSVAGNITLEPGGSGPVASSRPQLWRGADGFFGLQSGGDTSGAIGFYTSLSGTPSEQMRLNSTGLGIGTSSPAYKLDVSGTFRTTGIAYLGDATTTLIASIGNSGSSGVKIVQFQRASGTGDNVNIQGINTGIGAADFGMQVSGGNVGIGTASPAFKLDVAGTGNFQGIQTSGSPSLLFGANKWMIQYESNTTRAYYCGPDASTRNNWEVYSATSTGAPLLTARFNSDRNLAINNLGLSTTPTTSGTGITFPGTQAASSDSNTLDDYEEGTFTPAFASGTFTYGTRTGFYTKVGRLVTVNFFIMWSAKSGSGTLSVNGFPFTSTSAASYRATGAVGYTSGVGFAVGTQITWAMSQNYTGADLAIVITGAATQFADVSGMSAAGEIQGTISYIV